MLEYVIRKKRILVIGDVMLDQYFMGDVERISPEAPVPVFLKKSERSVLGGAANVAVNLIAANQDVSIMTVIGKDESGSKIIRLLHEWGIDTDFVLQSGRKTTVKTRFLASNNQQVMRLDTEENYYIGEEECTDFLYMLDNNLSKFDAVLISDYMKGMLSPKLMAGVMEVSSRYGVRVMVDAKDTDIGKYARCFLIKPNLSELGRLSGKKVGSKEEVAEASEYLRKICGCQFILTTMGAKGMFLKGEEISYFIDAIGKEVYDVTGAGDTAFAYLASCLCSGMEIRKAVDVSNYAAGLQIAKSGTSAVYLQEVIDFIYREKRGGDGKVLPSHLLSDFREVHRKKKIVFTNGCFDILHIGHIRYLQEAAKMGDILIVGVNSDASVRALKGDGRPINSELDRIGLLCALECVDYVTLFGETTPYAVIENLCPDVLVKGGDYSVDNIIGRDIVKANGGEVRVVPLIKDRSTTGIIDHIKQKTGG